MKKVMSQLEPMFSKNGFDSIPKVLFKIEENKVRAYATNGENYTEVSFECNVISGGEFIVSGEKLSDIIKNLIGEEITFSLTDDKRLLISSNKTSFRVALIDTNKDYLISPEVNNAKTFSINAQDLKNAITTVSCCINVQKVSLNCVVIHSNEGNNEKVFIAATDAMRLGVVEKKAKFSEKIPNLMIPKKSAEYMTTIIGEMQGDLEVKYTENMVQISTGSILYTTKLLDANFPQNYQSVIPTKNDKVLECDVVNLKKNIKSITSIDKLNFKIKLNLSKQDVKISCEEDGEDSEAKIEAEYTSDEQLDVVCNHKYLLEILDKISSSLVRIYFSNATTPMLIRPVDDEDVRYVLMPLVS